MNRRPMMNSSSYSYSLLIHRARYTQEVLRFTIFWVFLAICIGLNGMKFANADSIKKSAVPPIAEKCRTDLANRMKTSEEYITVLEVKRVTWPDTSLGMPELDKFYAQVMTPGYRIILQAQNEKYLYTADSKRFRYGGSLRTWTYSTLYIDPVPNDPNLNGNLYQCSMIGTNPRKVMNGVSYFYPQAKGAILCTRRTSRSSFTLLYVKAGDTTSVKTLSYGFGFDSVALDAAQSRWAAIMRPSLIEPKGVEVGRVGNKPEAAQTIPLPDGVSTGDIAWLENKLMILSKVNGISICYEAEPNAGATEWKKVSPMNFPGRLSMMLNKSESVKVNNLDENGKHVVQVSIVWFTGEHTMDTDVPDFELRDFDLLGNGYVFLKGVRNDKTITCSVNIHTGEVIYGYHGESENAKPFMYPPLDSPIK
jgi:hypothetical protein